jgi:ABC-type Fe3+/spermidine/putrescine transport system ATPase subunit
MPEETAKLELHRLSKHFDEVRAVDGIDLRVELAESVVLLGPSGCGKTTTLRAVAGFIRPDGGEIVLDGNVIATEQNMLPPEKRHLGMVFQNYAVWPHRTVFQNVAYGLKIAKRPQQEIKQRVDRALELVKLTGLDERYPGEVSGGQQQRVALARALVTEPSMLLLDEPLSNLDAGLREEMRFELKELQERIGMTTLYVTHDQEEALVLADRIVVMNAGRIEQVAAPNEIYLRPASRFVATFVGINNIVDGRIEDVDASDARVKISQEFGEPFWASAPKDRVGGLSKGAPVAVSVRPEAILVNGANEAAGNPPISARIQTSAFLGNRYDLRLDIRGREFRCQVPRMDFGEDIHVTFNSELAWVIE